MEKFEKAFISLRHWMIGRRMHVALRALEFASKIHIGKRKDGTTPEFYHQLSIASFLRTLENHLDDPETTMAAVCLHDSMEDEDISHEEISSKFGDAVAKPVKLLTKKHRGTKVPTEVYYVGMAENNIASIVKGGDRVNNMQTMVGVFSTEKQLSYIEETKTFVLPMLKTARRNFTTQEGAYENIKMILNSQIELLCAVHAAEKTKT